MPYKDVKFPTRDDAVMRLDGGVTLYKNQPVRLIMDGHELFAFPLVPNAKQFSVDWNSDDLITRNLATGYCDIEYSKRRLNKEGAIEYFSILTIAFFSRASHRRQKSVIHPTNMSISLPEELGMYADRASNYLYTKAFGDSLLGVFNPNRDFSKLGDQEGQALNRNFAILQVKDEQLLLFNEACIGRRRDYNLGFDLLPDYNNCLMLARLGQLGISVN